MDGDPQHALMLEQLHSVVATDTALGGTRTSFRLDERAFRYVEDARLRSRVGHGRAIDRGKLVSAVLHGLEDAGFDLAQPWPEAIAAAVSSWFGSRAGAATGQ